MKAMKQEPSASPTENMLVQIFAGLPRLADAACTGHSDLFDPPGEGEPASSAFERHDAAVRLCWQCPALAQCREWASAEPNTGAVLGGALPEHRGPGRPRKDTAA